MKNTPLRRFNTTSGITLTYADTCVYKEMLPSAASLAAVSVQLAHDFPSEGPLFRKHRHLLCTRFVMF